MFFPLLPFFFFGIGSVAIIVAVACIISRTLIREKIKEQYKNAAKAIIESKDIKEVKVGIYDHNDKYIQEMRITSELGIADDVYKKLVLYC